MPRIIAGRGNLAHIAAAMMPESHQALLGDQFYRLFLHKSLIGLPLWYRAGLAVSSLGLAALCVLMLALRQNVCGKPQKNR